MKKIVSLLLVVVMMFSVVACGALTADDLTATLEEAGYEVVSGDTDDLKELGLDKLPGEVVVGTKSESLLKKHVITIYIYETAEDAEAAKEAYDKGSLGLGDLLKNGVENNVFYTATTDEAVAAAFGE